MPPLLICEAFMEVEHEGYEITWLGSGEGHVEYKDARRLSSRLQNVNQDQSKQLAPLTSGSYITFTSYFSNGLGIAPLFLILPLPKEKDHLRHSRKH